MQQQIIRDELGETFDLIIELKVYSEYQKACVTM